MTEDRRLLKVVTRKGTLYETYELGLVVHWALYTGRIIRHERSAIFGWVLTLEDKPWQ